MQVGLFRFRTEKEQAILGVLRDLFDMEAQETWDKRSYVINASGLQKKQDVFCSAVMTNLSELSMI